MQEIYRSRSMASLVLKKQFLEENDIPAQIFLEGVDISNMPAHPVYGLSYHLEECAALVVDDEDEQRAWNLLNNIENPVGEEEDENEPYAFSDALERDEAKYHASREASGSLSMHDGSLKYTLIKACFVVFFLVFSVIWLYYAYVFLSSIWLESPGSKDWQEDAIFIPIGAAMIVLWLISVIVVLVSKARQR